MESVVEIRDAVRAGRASAAEVARRAVERARALNPGLNAFITIFDDAPERAARVDARIASGRDPGPLAGVPVAIKDNLVLDRGPTTCASRMLANYRSPFTATAVARLEHAGAVVIGKTNLDEFAMGSSTEHSAYGPTRNPWDHARTPGGSSGGSAAAVAAGIVPVALGSDTGGSIRQPAAHCGILGFKPTYGRVSRSGLVAFASSLDQVGPLARSARDAAEVLAVIAGHDALDATSLDAPAPTIVSTHAAGLRLGIWSVPGSTNHPAVDKALRSVAGALSGAGAMVKSVELSTTAHAIAAYYIIACAEASSNLARYDGVRFGSAPEFRADEPLESAYARARSQGFGREVVRRIMLGTHILSAGYYDQYYRRALRARRLIRDDFERALDGLDAILMPTTPAPAFELGAKARDPMALYLEDAYTVAANLAGLPAASIPVGLAREGDAELPIGVQLVGAAGDDARVLAAAGEIERLVGFTRRPR